MMSFFTKKSKQVSNDKIEQVKTGPYSCPLCNESGIDMLPVYTVFGDAMRTFFSEYQRNQSIHNIFLYETFNMADYGCSNCRANDKDRLYALFIDRFFKENPGVEVNLLDIAPSPQLAAFLKKVPQIRYRSMDLYMEGVDDKVDITSMDIYKDEHFDFFICSHVLEHIPEDLKAMRELHRVLKSGGKGIVMVPINFGVKETLEDPYCTDIPTRWKYFGQDDHIRIYAKKDFISRLQSVGFKVDLLDINYFSSEVFEKNAIYPTSVLYVVTKK
jgi:SAM-dependent methyltransferase